MTVPSRWPGAQRPGVPVTLMLLLGFLLPRVTAADALEVALVPVKAATIERTITLPGELAPFESVTLFARVQGFVEKVLVDKGSMVQRGQTLITLSAPEITLRAAAAESQLQTAKAQRAEAEASQRAAEIVLRQLEKAAKTEGAISGGELLRARTAKQTTTATVEALASQIAAAESSLRVARQMEDYLTVTAPFDGVITARYVHPGALAGPTPDGALLRLEQIRRLRLDVGVPEADAASVKQGAIVEFTVPAHRTRRFTGRVARISRSVDPKSRTMSVELDVDNAAGLLSPGMYPEVYWPVRGTGSTLTVPPTAVVRTTERTFVVRVRQGAAEWVDVRRGPAIGDQVEVTGDLAPGDLVVVRGSDEIRPGTRIQGAAAK